MSWDAEAEARLEGFIARFSDEVAASARAAIARMREILPGAATLVYDNYNALAVGFGATDKQAGLVFSIAVYPRWVSLFLVGGPALDDPHGLLKGEGGVVRHIVLDTVARLDDPRVRALMDQALAQRPIDPTRPARLIIRSVSARQRPRRPA
jgi:hypothetical protein